MATANDLFRTAGYNEPHIIIDGDRFVNVPKELKYLGVQFDHNIETVVFDCPRYWDGHDLSELDIYINYTDVRGTLGAHHCDDVSVSETDENIINFSWTILQNLTLQAGKIAFLVCAQKPNDDGTVEQCWHSRMCSECEILPGLECAHSRDEDDIVVPDNYDLSNAIFNYQTDEEIEYSILSHLKTATGPVVYPITKARAVETDAGEILENILINLRNELTNVKATATSNSSAVVTAQNTANNAQAAADNAQTAADNAQTAADKAQLAADKGITDANNAQVTANNAINQSIQWYTHSKSGTVHNLQGSGENIKFIATADWNAGDSLTINGETTHCLNNMLERIEGEELFKRNVTVTATVRAMNGYNRCFFKLGGAGLNFKIVGAATQPASPKENTIWINTSTSIKNWQFAVSQPTKRADGTALQNGDLWIKTGIDTNVEFNAVKKNAIKLKLVNSYQWNGSAWVTKTAKIYINSKWTSLSFVMYEKGAFAVTYSQSGDLGGITIGTDSIRFYNTSYPVDNHYQYINLGGEIDWSQYSTVKVTLKSYTYSGSKPCYIAIGSSKTARDLASKSMGNSYVQTLDVSNVKTRGYLNIGIQVGVQSSGTTDVYVERIEVY